MKKTYADAEKGKAGEDEDADGQEGDEQSQLLVAAMQRVSERLEPGRVTGQLEDAQNPHDAKDLHDPARVVDLSGGESRGLGKRQRDVVRHDRKQVDDIERFSQIPQSVKRNSSPQYNV